MFNPYYNQPNYPNPYEARLNAMQVPHKMDIVSVNGQNGAQAFQMPPNSRALLLDESAPVVWLVQTDGAGYKTTTPYNITPYQMEPTPDLNSLEARIKRLEELLNESNTSSSQPKRTSTNIE